MRSHWLPLALLFALPGLAAEDPSALLKTLAKAAAPDERREAVKAIQAQKDRAAFDAAWVKAVHENNLGLSEAERANLWMEYAWWGMKNEPEAVIQELQAFRKACPKSEAYGKGLKNILNREALYGKPGTLEAYVKAFGGDLPETDRAYFTERVSRFRKGGQPPPFLLKDWDGKSFDLGAQKGRAVLIYSWGSH